MTITWQCIQCPETGTTDGGAERHTKTSNHATVTSVRGGVNLAQPRGCATDYRPSKAVESEAQVKTAPGTRCANSESDSQGLARRYEGAPN